MMIFTARQLQDLHSSNGHVMLPLGARLTPLAQDWLRQKKIVIGYDGSSTATAEPTSGTAARSSASTGRDNSATTDTVLWWCDGPCGAAKAAIAAQGRETQMVHVKVDSEPRRLVDAIKAIANDLSENRAAGGVLIVQSGAPAVVYANRCQTLRAILGTCRQSVEEGVRQVAANVLVIEHPYQTLSQVRNMLGVFTRGIATRDATDEVRQRMSELTQCE